MKDMKVRYIAGLPFKYDGATHYNPGDEIPAEKVELLPHKDAFISTGYIYPVVDDEGYDRLPPHIFTAVMTQREAEQKIEMANSAIHEVNNRPGVASEEQELAEAQAQVQREIPQRFDAARKANMVAAAKAKRDEENATTTATSDAPAADAPAVTEPKTTTKKTATKKTS